MIPFNDKYAEIHVEIQENADLVRRIYSLAKEKGLIRKKDEYHQIYFPCGSIDDLFLGLDVSEIHNYFFSKILAKMRLLYEVSEGTADLPKVYAQLDVGTKGLGIGIVSEDMSQNGKFEIVEATKSVDSCVPEVFSKNEPPRLDLEIVRTTFQVRPKGQFPIRFPIVDLDHVDVRQKYQELFVKYSEQYKTDERFRIHEI